MVLHILQRFPPSSPVALPFTDPSDFLRASSALRLRLLCSTTGVLQKNQWHQPRSFFRLLRSISIAAPSVTHQRRRVLAQGNKPPRSDKT